MILDDSLYTTRLDYLCPLCGEPLFSVSCFEPSSKIIKHSKLCVVKSNSGRISFNVKCNVFCFLFCSKRRIEINLEDIRKLSRYKNNLSVEEKYKNIDMDVDCEGFIREYRNIFENIFSLISMDKGFEI